MMIVFINNGDFGWSGQVLSQVHLSQGMVIDCRFGNICRLVNNWYISLVPIMGTHHSDIVATPA